MARDQKVKVRIEAQDKASPQIKKSQNSFQKFGSYLAGNFKKILGVTAVAIAALVAGLVKFGNEAYKQERNIKRLESALKPLGSAAKEVRNDLLAQANALAALTGESDTTIISMQALLAQMGVQGPKIAQAAQASVDLSSALGIDLNSAARNVGKTIGGFAGELGELIPELKNLSAEALQAGEGIDLLTEKFGGAAEAARTGGEAFGELGNAMGDFGRNLVSVVANSKEVMELVDALAAAIRQLTPEFEHNEDVLSSWKDVIINTNETLSLQVGAIRDWLSSIGKSEDEIGTFIDNLNTLRRSGLNVKEAFEAIVTSWERAIDIQKRMDEVTKSLGTSLSALGVKLSKDLNAELDKLDTLMAKATAQYRNGEISARDYAVSVEAIAKKQKELKAELSGNTETIDENTTAIKGNTAATGAAVTETDKLTASLNKTSAAYRNQSAAAKEAERARTGDPLIRGGGPGGGTFTQITRAGVRVGPDGTVFYG